MDRDYDNVKMMTEILGQNDDFIIRLKKNGHLFIRTKNYQFVI